MIISGKELAAKLKAEMAEQVKTFPEKYGRVPHLVVILVGNDPGSQTYVRNKEKACDVVGFNHTTFRMPEETPEKEVLDKIAELNADDGVDGILVQLPLPKHISETKVIEAISKEKDVDGFHPLNTAALWQKRPNNTCVVPCTPAGIIKLLEDETFFSLSCGPVAADHSTFSMQCSCNPQHETERQGFYAEQVGTLLYCGQEHFSARRKAFRGESRRSALSPYSTPLLGASHTDVQGFGHEHTLHIRVLEYP